jgi:hypothetical protein
MCNLYSITTNQAAIIALFRVVNRYVGNLAPMPGVFPDYKAPIVRNGSCCCWRTLSAARCWRSMACALAKKAGSRSGMGPRRTSGVAAPKQHLLNFLPLPHRHGSFLPIFIFGIIAESCRCVMPLTDALGGRADVALPAAASAGSTEPI